MKYKYIFFDIDDTLWDCKANSIATFLEVFNQFGVSEIDNDNILAFYKFYEDLLPNLLQRYQEGDITQQQLRVMRMQQSMIAFKVNRTDLAPLVSDNFIRSLPTKGKTLPNSFEIINYLSQKGYELNIISNGFDKLQKEKLFHAGLLPFFKNIITSERARASKPGKEIFQFAFQETKATPAESIMIGDHFVNDVIGARNVGLHQVYLQHDPTLKHAFEPTHTITSLLQLKQLF